MKRRLSFIIPFFAMAVSSIGIQAQTQSDARQAWGTAIERLAQREAAHCNAFAIVSIERSIQRLGEEEPTVITKAIAQIWKDAPKYRVEIDFEICLESSEQSKPYSPSGIRKETITFDGKTVCQARDMESGARTGIDYGDNYALPLMFAGFPSPDPIRPWTLHMPVAHLKKREFDAEYLNSGMAQVQLKPVDSRDRNRSFFYLLPDSNEIRRCEVKDVSGKVVSTVDLTWGEFNGSIFAKRFVRRGRTGSSQFPKDSFQEVITFEVLQLQSDVSVADDWFSRDAKEEGRKWTELSHP